MNSTTDLFKYLVATLFAIATSFTADAQSVGIAGSSITPNSKSILEIESNAKGVLLPRMSTTERNAITGLGGTEEGLTIYNETSKLYNYWDGTQWVEMQTVAATTGAFVENQSAADQSADFRITGNGTIHTALGVGALANIATARVLIHDASMVANELQLLVEDFASLPVLAVQDIGRVGIGTATPITTLDVVGKGVVQNAGEILTLDPGYATGARLAIGTIATPDQYLSLGNDGTKTYLFTRSNDFALYSTLANPGFFFEESNGNIGLETDAPNAKLEVRDGASTGNFLIRAIKNSDVANELAGIGFGSEVNLHHVKSAIVHERESANGTGKLHFLVDDQVDGNDVTLSEARMTIDRNGLVGIGTTSPAQELSIENNGVSDATILFRTDDGTTASTAYDASALVAGWEASETAWNQAYFKINTHPTNTSSLGTAMIVKGPDVGIGTISPSARLEVAGGRVEFTDVTDASGSVNSGVLEIANSLRIDGNEIITNSSSPLYLQNDNDGDLIVDATTLVVDASTNRVGIGTTTPQQELHIDGASDFRVDVTDATYVQVGNLFSSTDVLSLESMGDVQVVIDENNNDASKSFFIKRNTTTATGNDIVAEFGEEGWLKVGNPTSPSAQSNATQVSIYYESFDVSGSVFDYWTHGNICGNGGDWFIPLISNGFIYWEHDEHDDDDVAYSPWIHIPTQVEGNSLEVEFNTWVCTEGGWDGMRCELSINGGSWAKATNYTSGAPTTNAEQNCGSPRTADAYAGGSETLCFDNGTNYNGVFDLDANGADPGDWVRFRFKASTDGSVEECCEDIELYDFAVNGRMEQYSAGFQYGSIYASGNVFANSTQLLGDVAEYFPVDGSTRPGDLIAMNTDKTDSYKVADFAYNPFVIGVHSTNPSVLLNSPEAGSPIALTGRVPVNVTMENGAIKPGDFLTSSSRKGFAMKADKSCFIVGKALGYMDEDEGSVLCLVDPSWYNPAEESGQFGSGSFIIKKGETTVSVQDNRMLDESKVFVSMLTNPGSHFWIDQKQNGAFTIHLEKPSEDNVRFDYFIENAGEDSYDQDDQPTQVASIASNADNNSEEEMVMLDGKLLPKSVAEDTDTKSHPLLGESRLLREEPGDGLGEMPPSVGDPALPYIWTPGKALKELPWANKESEELKKD